MKIAILGIGAWGTALTRLLQEQKHELILWDWDEENLRRTAQTGENQKYLPGIQLERDFTIAPTPAEAAQRAELILVVLRSTVLREILSQVPSYEGIIVCATKGIEFETGLTMSGILRSLHPRAKIAALSGPTLALEVAKGIPTAAVAASEDEETARLVQALFHRPTFRVYTSSDILGVELGGALKNVIAIAAGICDGLGFGANSKAALVTRGIAEMRRIGVACGAQPETFSGLSGIGDLVVTCFSPLSRNRTLGERLGRGESLEQILASTVAVAEGVPTARAALRLARSKGVEAPITEQVHAILYEKKPVSQALHELLHRSSKPED